MLLIVFAHFIELPNIYQIAETGPFAQESEATEATAGKCCCRHISARETLRCVHCMIRHAATTSFVKERLCRAVTVILSMGHSG